ncbi:hypothetical protein BJY01DRAFT_230573 [Aspergillus pseudoustus]|uniref:Uncharacterized protein n=1 Tax=Aspergillus pseudoustus TaxID=1810923 RepID=A0ABR4I8K8_9EURO
MPPFTMGYYGNTQFQQSAGPPQGAPLPQNSIPVMRPPGTGLGGYPQPYYFNY